MALVCVKNHTNSLNSVPDSGCLCEISYKIGEFSAGRRLFVWIIVQICSVARGLNTICTKNHTNSQNFVPDGGCLCEISYKIGEFGPEGRLFV